ncbi:MAG TPA: 6-phospho-3-hexuloisomerase [Verrucomicrobiae bacterium]|nr:6-phospho-3-hexuloisomerase [Verrucomicrobiae bacterium]
MKRKSGRSGLGSSVQSALQTLLEENKDCAARLDEQALARLLKELRTAKRVFVLGQGRSGLVMRMFAMRLMHAGVEAFVVGETSTPPIGRKDLLFACSGTGETAVTCILADRAAKRGAKVVCMTAAAKSRLSRIAKATLIVPATPKRGNKRAKGARSDKESVQFAGSLFEQEAVLVCDALCMRLSQAKRLNSAAMWARHANLE